MNVSLAPFVFRYRRELEYACFWLLLLFFAFCPFSSIADCQVETAKQLGLTGLAFIISLTKRQTGRQLDGQACGVYMYMFMYNCAGMGKKKE